jgi:hypothetical protein
MDRRIILQTFFHKSLRENLDYSKVTLEISGEINRMSPYKCYEVYTWDENGLTLSSNGIKDDGYLSDSDMRHWEILSLRKGVRSRDLSPSIILRIY